MKPDWDSIVEAAEQLREKPAVHRIDGSRNISGGPQFKVYRVEGDIIRVDILPIKEAITDGS